MRHGLRGQCYGTVSACAAGAHAIGAGLRMVQHGDADAASSAAPRRAHAAGRGRLRGAWAPPRPAGISRPFDARRDGFVMGEGAGVLVLEARAPREARGAEVLGELLGYGATADAHHLTAPEPEGARRRARDRARARRRRLRPERASTTSTRTAPRRRSTTARRPRRSSPRSATRAARVPVSSAKSAIGHLLGAAGAVEAVATVLALRERVAPPTLGWEERDEGLDLDYVPGSAAAAARGTASARAIGDLELVRLRRPQRRAVPGGGRR